jgi:hypothetical protein
MKYYLLVLLAFIATIAFSQSKIDPYVKTITQENIEKHIYTLAADSLEGRKTAEKGQKIAARYISDYYRVNHLDSLGFNSYYQPFTLQGYERIQVRVFIKNNNANSEKYPDLYLSQAFFFSKEMQVHDTLKFEYVGYGHDLKPGNLSDKAILILLDENLGKTYENIRAIASNNQAKVFVILFSKGGLWSYNSNKRVLDEQRKSRPIGALMSGLYEMTAPEYMDKYHKRIEIINGFAKADDTIFTAIAFPWHTQYLFKESYKELEKLEKNVAKGKAERNVQLLTDSLICHINAKNYQVKNYNTENVLSYIEGTDLKDEVIVVTAHYDHVGMKKGKACVGADDNASGTAAVMELARAFQEAANNGIKPRRSILFAAVSGEELGLRGSDFFVKNSPVPLENIILNVNLDMIGRNNKDKEKYNQTAYFLTMGDNKRLYRRIAKRNDKKNPNLKLSKHPGLMKKLIWSFSSDHFRFRRKNIPAAVVFTGLHPDYHTPRDTPDKINYPKTTQITRVTYKTIWDIANVDKSLKVEIKHPDKQNLTEKFMD